MNSNFFYLSIDLGTSNSVAYLYDGRQERLVMVQGYRVLPSCVWYRNNKTVQVGVSAQNATNNHNNRVIQNSKRIIGKKLSSDELIVMEKQCGVKLEKKGDGAIFYLDNINEYVTPEEVATHIVKTIIDCAKEMTGNNCKLKKILVTVPANFNNDQKTATRAAVYNAIKNEGIAKNEIQLLTEPCAAAICYGLDNKDSFVHEKKVLIYDFGGGTFDVSLLNIKNGIVNVLDYDGNPTLGGSDCDRMIAEDFLKIYADNHEDLMKDVDENDRVNMFRSVQNRACSAKVSLSNSDSVDVTISDIFYFDSDDDDDDDDDSCDFEYTRNDMNRVISPVIDETLTVVDRILKRNHTSIDDIDSVILVGGSSRIWLAAEKLKQKFGDKILKTIDPDTCVAQGGCRFLINHHGIELDDQSPIVNDKITYSLGLELTGERVCWIIPLNSDIPKKASDNFTTTDDYQEHVETSLIQGKCDKAGHIEPINLSIHTKLSKISFGGLIRLPKGQATFDIEYGYTRSGVVHVKVTEKNRNKILFDDDVEYNN